MAMIFSAQRLISILRCGWFPNHEMEFAKARSEWKWVWKCVMIPHFMKCDFQLPVSNDFCRIFRFFHSDSVCLNCISWNAISQASPCQYFIRIWLIRSVFHDLPRAGGNARRNEKGIRSFMLSEFPVCRFLTMSLPVSMAQVLQQ